MTKIINIINYDFFFGDLSVGNIQGFKERVLICFLDNTRIFKIFQISTEILNVFE